ncbi:MAG: Bug family tripartite tricarboxylate transporter substrate binding protein [Beijerinckiaceae bacterium]
MTRPTVTPRHAAIALSGACAALLGFGTTPPAAAQSVAEFYKGKTVSVYSGLSEGGSYSNYARLVQRHLGKHIPGNPGTVFRHKPGAVGMVLARWMNSVAPKDGLIVGTFHERIALEPLIAPQGIPFNGRDFTWIAALGTNPSVCFTWAATGIKTVKDTQSKEVISGASGIAATDAVMARLMNATLGTKFRIIFGYKGADVLLAMEQGEVQARCGFGYPSLKTTRPQWLRDKKINILAQLSDKPHPEIPDVPLLMNLVAPQYKAAVRLAGATDAMARPYAAPPGIPKDRAEALRKAFADMMKDKEFLADAKKQNLEIDFTPGSEISGVLDDLYKTPKEAVELLRKFRTPGATESKIAPKKK